MTVTALTIERSIYNWPHTSRLYTGLIMDTPKVKKQSYACVVEVKALSTSHVDRFVHKKVIIYIAKEARSRKLSAGDYIKFMATLRPISHTVTVDGFDYADYMLLQGISASAFVQSDLWRLESRGHLPFGYKQVQSVKQWVLSLYEYWFKDHNELSVLKALTLGVKDDLTYEQKTLFSDVGASHLLALSGLHLGILCGLLNFMLFFLWSYPCQKIKNIIILVIVWLFAFMIGFPTSIVRAAVMLTAFFIVKMIDREHSTINAMSWAAFFILLFSPLSLYDVGFQLSFCAVAGILVIVPVLNDLWTPKNKFIRYFYGIITVSTAAQIGVFPLVLYHFSTFPVYFLITNLLAIPLVALILWLAVALLVVTPVTQVQGIIAVMLSRTIKIMNSYFTEIAKWPHSIIEYKVTIIESIGLALLVVSLVMLLKNRKLKWAYISVILFSLFSVGRAYSFSVYSSSPSIQFGIVEKKESYIRFIQSRNHCELYCINHPKVSLCLPNKEGIIRFQKKTICVLSDKRWRKYRSRNPLRVDYLYISSGYRGHLEEIGKLFVPKIVILDSSLSQSKELMLKKKCEILKIQLISLSEKGTCQFPV